MELYVNSTPLKAIDDIPCWCLMTTSKPLYPLQFISIYDESIMQNGDIVPSPNCILKVCDIDERYHNIRNCVFVYDNIELAKYAMKDTINKKIETYLFECCIKKDVIYYKGVNIYGIPMLSCQYAKMVKMLGDNCSAID